MRAIHAALTLAGGLALFLGAVPLHAEPTEHEKWALELRRSEDRQIELLGDRWYGLVKLLEWKDESGKYSVNAKYVSHDADFKTVTLLAVKRTQDGRVEREVTVPFEKLGVMSQARVRRIAKLKPIIEQRVAEAKAAREEEEEAAAETGFEDGRGISGEEGYMDTREPARGERLEEEFDSRDAEAQRGRAPLQPDERTAERPARPARPPLEEPSSTAADDSLTDPRLGTNPTTAPPDYAVSLEYVADDFPLERDTESGEWQEFFEPLGDESHLEFRLVPAQPVAGETAKLLVIPSSIYGRPQPKTYVRIGEASVAAAEVSRSSGDGPAWAQMPLVGGRIQDPRTEQMVLVSDTEEISRAEQPGESYYVIGLVFPPGRSVLDFKFEDDSLGTVAFRAMEVETAPARSEREDLREIR